MEELIDSTLAQCAKDGFTASAIEAALNTTEFHLRENNTGRFPRGLSLMLRAMGNWIYDKDPYEALQWTEPLNAFKARPSHTAEHICLLDESAAPAETSSSYLAASCHCLANFTQLQRRRPQQQSRLASHKSDRMIVNGVVLRSTLRTGSAQARLAGGEDVFGPLIRRFLLQNTHKVTVELLPDAKLGAQIEQDEKARLKVMHVAEGWMLITPLLLTACTTWQAPELVAISRRPRVRCVPTQLVSARRR